MSGSAATLAESESFCFFKAFLCSRQKLSNDAMSSIVHGSGRFISMTPAISGVISVTIPSTSFTESSFGM